jgi:hypothetical protein
LIFLAEKDSYPRPFQSLARPMSQRESARLRDSASMPICLIVNRIVYCTNPAQELCILQGIRDDCIDCSGAKEDLGGY